MNLALSPPRLLFGAGSLSQLTEELARPGVEKPFFLSDRCRVHSSTPAIKSQ